MLYLNPPFHVINGVSLLRDHADPLQWYYLPVAPKLTRVLDPPSGQRIPQLQLVKFRGSAGSGGFLNFDVNIGVGPAELDDIGTELTRVERLRERPRLAAVPLIDGTVRMMLFGKQTGDPTGPGDPGEPKFVVKIDQPAKPALYGDNQAAFSVRLDQSGVTLLETALQGEIAPIGIVYSLDFLALRPAYSVRVDVKWDRVQKHLGESFSVEVVYVSSEIDKAVDELIESRAIVIEVDTFVPEGEDSSAILSRRDQAVNEVRDMVTEAFFQPSLDPEKEATDGWDRAAWAADRVSQIAVSGGWSSVGSFSYKKTDLTRIDRKSLVYNMSERTTVKRSIYPQGHLSGLFRVLRQEGLDLSRFVMAVDLDDPWFARRRLKVISRANFDEDSIGSINVKLRYGSEPKNTLLESSTARNDLEWGSLIEGGAMRRKVEASYTVTFRGVDGTEQPVSLQSPVETVEDENLEINPRELYSIVQVPIIALGFPWERYPHVEVQTRYVDEPNGIRVADDFLLDKAHEERTWKMFVRNPERTAFQYKLIFRAADHKDLERPWVETGEERITIRDPHPHKRAIQVVPNFKWTEVDRAFVDVTYEDPEHDVLREESFEFNQAHAESRSFVVDLRDPDRRLVAYRVTVMFKDGRLVEIPRSVTLERRIIVRADMKGHRIVLVRPEAGDFTARGLAQVSAELRYEDREAGLSYADLFRFKSEHDRAHFEFDYVDDERANYERRITYLLTNGLVRSTDWEPADADELVLPVT
jgi:hypothetical protein